jgi:hypothetical protein
VWNERAISIWRTWPFWLNLLELSMSLRDPWHARFIVPALIMGKAPARAARRRAAVLGTLDEIRSSGIISMTWPPDVATFSLERANAIQHTAAFPPVESRILRDEVMRFVQDGQRTQRRAAVLHERARLARQGLSRSQNLPAMRANETSMSRADDCAGHTAGGAPNVAATFNHGARERIRGGTGDEFENVLDR